MLAIVPLPGVARHDSRQLLMWKWLMICDVPPDHN